MVFTNPRNDCLTVLLIVNQGLISGKTFPYVFQEICTSHEYKVQGWYLCQGWNLGLGCWIIFLRNFVCGSKLCGCVKRGLHFIVVNRSRRAKLCCSFLPDLSERYFLCLKILCNRVLFYLIINHRKLLPISTVVLRNQLFPPIYTIFCKLFFVLLWSKGFKSLFEQ